MSEDNKNVHTGETDGPVYTMDDQTLEGDIHRDEEGWSDDVPDALELNFEGEHDHSGSGHGDSSSSGVRKTPKEGYIDGSGKAHRRAPASNTTRHHHRRIKGWKRGLLIFAVALVAVVAVVLITWRVLDAIGRGRLYEQGNAVPTLASRDTEEDSVAEDGESGETATSLEETIEELEEEGISWQADWVRYNGTVYDYNENILTFLVMGIDHSSEVEEADNAILGGQADALFLLVMNPDEKEISFVAIDRATMVDIDVYSEEDEYLYTTVAQICLQHGYGNGLEESCERQAAVVSELFYGLGINGYVSINMSAIPIINNSIGGVTLEALESVPVSSMSTSGVVYNIYDTRRDLVAGETYTLSGFEAYGYTRYRSTAIEDSASGRLARQKQYLQKFITSMKSAVMSDITVVSDLYDALSSYMVTDLDLTEVTYLASNIAGYSINSTFYQLEGTTITGEAGSESTFDEFYVDDDALYELMLELFYTEVEI